MKQFARINKMRMFTGWFGTFRLMIASQYFTGAGRSQYVIFCNGEDKSAEINPALKAYLIVFKQYRPKSWGMGKVLVKDINGVKLCRA